MRRSDAHGYRQAYNAQAVVCADGSQLVLATGVVATPAAVPTGGELLASATGDAVDAVEFDMGQAARLNEAL
jgi:hypothetical protein